MFAWFRMSIYDSSYCTDCYTRIINLSLSRYISEEQRSACAGYLSLSLLLLPRCIKLLLLLLRSLQVVAQLLQLLPVLESHTVEFVEARPDVLESVLGHLQVFLCGVARAFVWLTCTESHDK